MLAASSSVMLNTALAQVIGFFRTAMIASYFGASIEVDSYYISLVVPTFVATAVASWLQVGFVGQYSILRSQSRETDAVDYRTSMILSVAFVSIAVMVVCIAFPYQVMSALLPENQSSSVAAQALVLSSLTIAPILLSDFFALILNCHGGFFAPSVAPVVNAAVSVFSLWIWPSADLNALLLTLVLGSLGQFSVVFVALLRSKIGFRLSFGRGKELAWKSLFVGMPVIPAILLSNATSATIQLRSAQLGEGAVSILNYAQRLSGSIGQVLVIGIGTILLPQMASLMSQENRAAALAVIRKISRVAVAISAYFLVGIYLFGFPAVKAILSRGSFSVDIARHVWEVWFILTISLLPFSLGTFIAKVAQATQKSVMILISSAILFGVIWVATLCGVAIESLSLIAASLALAYSATAIFWLVWMMRSFDGGVLIQDLLQSLVFVAPAIAAGTLCDLAVSTLTGSWLPILEVAVRGAIYTIAFGAALELLRFRKWLGQTGTVPSTSDLQASTQ